MTTIRRQPRTPADATRHLTPEGVLLERARRDLGISQDEAARRANFTSRSRWGVVITGRRTDGSATRPTDRVIAQCALAVDLPADELEGARPLAAAELRRLQRPTAAPDRSRNVPDPVELAAQLARYADIYGPDLFLALIGPVLGSLGLSVITSPTNISPSPRRRMTVSGVRR